jgi:hypothetical protein
MTALMIYFRILKKPTLDIQKEQVSVLSWHEIRIPGKLPSRRAHHQAVLALNK